jgi:hypothetical protein
MMMMRKKNPQSNQDTIFSKISISNPSDSFESTKTQKNNSNHFKIYFDAFVLII